MLVIASFEFIPSEASIAVYCACVVSPHRCSVDNTGSCASARDWTGCSPVYLAVAPSLSLVLVVLLEYLGIVFVYVGLEVGHAPVAHFNGVLVKDFVKGVVGWEIFGDHS